MNKIKKAFFCRECGYESAKWTGKCPACQAWNSFTEEIIHKGEEKRKMSWKENDLKGKDMKSLTLEEIEWKDEARIITPDTELNRVLGGGIVPGSLILAAGEPGIGKSTLFLQAALSMKQTKTLYISGEESENQIKMRAERLHLHHNDLYLLTETSTQEIFQEIRKRKPGLVIVDSIQTLQSTYLDSAPGSISQIRECTAEFQRYAKESGTPVFLIGHITKDGSIAGPKLLEHMVDTVLQFEGDQHYAYRILRTTKNRFGSTSELGHQSFRHTHQPEGRTPERYRDRRRHGGPQANAHGSPGTGDPLRLRNTATYGKRLRPPAPPASAGSTGKKRRIPLRYQRCIREHRRRTQDRRPFDRSCHGLCPAELL
jgi:DNA repair protein RadA/Sms